MKSKADQIKPIRSQLQNQNHLQMDLSSLTTHAQRLSARLAENLAEGSKDLGLDPEYNAATSTGSNALNQTLPIIAQGLLNHSRLWDRYLEISTSKGESETKRLLGSRHETERVEGLKRILVVCRCRNSSQMTFNWFVIKTDLAFFFFFSDLLEV